MKMNKYIFLDFNGTVLDDIDICLELLNDILKECNQPTINKERYLEVFGFPVRDYYVRAGVDLEHYDFNVFADYFIKEYTLRNIKECQIFPEFYPFIEKAKKRGFKIVLCSASKLVLLKDQLKSFNILECFDDVIGLDNHFAASKVELAMSYLKNNNINPLDVTFIGDTTHDYEVGVACGSRSILVSKGHQSINVLKTATNEIYPNLLEALDSIK